jgi:hypothetical protein
MSHLFISGPIGINRTDLSFFHENMLKSGEFSEIRSLTGNSRHAEFDREQ